ncbi:enoyl-CoA hydratase-related protein [Saccharopolyspora shandongensis]|uniref:enoyl-CoA hydratase-related protein n=1 Tax=Saccharopolyspora shandongensis TaxID=418495 RepID=UPI0033E37729
MDSAEVRYEVNDAVATITMNRPHRRNAVSKSFMAELAEVLGAAAADDDVRVVILTGCGDYFNVGADLASPPETRGLSRISKDRDRHHVLDGSRCVELLHRMPKVTIAAINGACAGAGLGLALATDLRYAIDTAKFNTAFLTAGISGDMAAVWFASQVAAPQKVRELFLIPQKFTAAQALEWNLLNDVVPADELPARVTAVARRIAGFAPLATRHMKANLNDALVSPLSEYLPREVDRVVDSAHTEDSVEAARAFLEKRAPKFTGR